MEYSLVISQKKEWGIPFWTDREISQDIMFSKKKKQYIKQGK